MIRRFIKKACAVVAIGFFTTGFATNFSQLQQDISSNPGIHVGMQVIDPATGQSLYQYQAEQYFHPASITKLFTAISAMLSLGGNYHFVTSLQVNPQKIQNHILNGNVYIKFSGDPSLTASDLNNLLANLQQAGIQKINGNVILDNTIFLGDTYAFGVPQEDNIWSYGAKSSSITINENAFNITFANTKAAKPAIAKMSSPLITVHSNLMWSNQQNADICTFRVDAIGNDLTLNGCLPPRLGASLALAIPDPNLYAINLVQQDLKTLGIKISGKVVIGSMPAKASQVLGTHQSAALSDMLRYMLKVSDNVYASAITKTMGVKVYGIGTEKAGVVAIQNILAPFNLPNSYLENGSGTSDLNLVTPTVMTDLLYQAKQNPMLQSFLNSALPAFSTPKLKGKIIAKTGEMTHIFTVTGFMQMANGHTVIFSVLVDNTPIAQSQIIAFENKLLEDLYGSGA